MFKIDADPTFKTKVKLCRAGGEAEEVTFEYRHKTTEEAKAFLDRAESLKPIEWAREIVCGWEGIGAAFDEEALAKLLANHFSAAEAIMSGFLKGLSGGRLGN